MDADAQGEIEHPTTVSQHRPRAAADAGTEIWIKGGAAAEPGELVQLGEHLRRGQWWLGSGLRGRNSLAKQREGPLELRPEGHPRPTSARASRSRVRCSRAASACPATRSRARIHVPRAAARTPE